MNTTSTLRISYWSDYACPYCYIGVARLRRAAAALGLRPALEMRSFELAPDAPLKTAGDTTTRFARKYGLSPEDAARRIEAISALGRGEGLDFRYATTRYTRTFDAHRLTHYARSLGDAGRTEKLEELLYAAYFTHNLELADHAVLLDAARQAGLPPDGAAEALATGRFAEDVRRDERDAMEAGVHGVPYFLIGGTVVPGAAAFEDLKALLADAARPSSGPAGAHACGPDGCAWRP